MNDQKHLSDRSSGVFGCTDAKFLSSPSLTAANCTLASSSVRVCTCPFQAVMPFCAWNVGASTMWGAQKL